MISLYAYKNKLTVLAKELLTSGSQNVNTVQFEFSPDWDGLTKTAVFKAGSDSFSVLLTQSDCPIPWEVLTTPGRTLYAGLYGTRGGKLVLPTIWASLGEIQEGTKLGEDAKDPTPGVYERITGELANKADGMEYDGLNLSLKAGEKVLDTVQITGGGGGEVVYQFGHGLKVSGRIVSVDAVSDFSGDNTLPITAAGVQTSVGNIEALLATI